MRVLSAGFSIMQQTKKDAEMGVTDDHREGLAEYNEKIQRGEVGGGAAPNPAAGTPSRGASAKRKQQHPGGMAPGASSGRRSNSHRGPSRGGRRGWR